METWEGWQREYQHGTIVIWPPDDVRAVVNRLRQAYDPASHTVCEAHITLTQPLQRPLHDGEWTHLAEELACFAPFQIDYGPLNSFLPYPCIYYEIRPQGEVLAMREAVHQTGLFNLSLPYTEGFVPHMTITEGQSGPPVEESLLVSLTGQVQSGSFWCPDVAYILPDGTFHFEVVRRIPLAEVTRVA